MPLAALTIIAVGSAIVAAVTSAKNSSVSTLAGVVVGAVVTAAGTWVVGPSLERRVRRESERDDAITKMIDELDALRHDAGDLETLLARPSRLKSALGRITAAATDLRQTARRTRSPRIIVELESFINAAAAARLATWDLPEEEEIDDGRVPVTIRFGGPFARRSVPADEQTSEIVDLVVGVYPALIRLMDVLLQEGSYPSRSVAASTKRQLSDTYAERQLAAKLTKVVITELANDDELCESVGLELFALMSVDDGSDGITTEINQLKLAEGLGSDAGPVGTGKAALLLFVSDENENYPHITAAIAQVVKDSVSGL